MILSVQGAATVTSDITVVWKILKKLKLLKLFKGTLSDKTMSDKRDKTFQR